MPAGERHGVGAAHGMPDDDRLPPAQRVEDCQQVTGKVLGRVRGRPGPLTFAVADRKSTRLNSSHDQISYAVFCLKKKKLTALPSLPNVVQQVPVMSSTRTMLLTTSSAM